MDPTQVKCAFCKGGGQVTFEQFDARQEELKREQEAKETEAKRRAEEAAAEAARRYEEDAPRRAAAELRVRKEANTLGQFIYALIGAIVGYVLTAVMAISTRNLEMNAVLLGVISSAVGAAIGLQVFFGKSKQCIVKSFLRSLLAGVFCLIVTIIAIAFIPNPPPLLGWILLSAIAVLTALGALRGA